jgi:hypothetical protein
MNSRLSEEYNIRAARLAMIPGGVNGLVLNVNEGGEPRWKQFPAKKTKRTPTTMTAVPKLIDIARLREKYVKKYETHPYETGTTFTNVLGTKNMNAQYTRVPGAEYPDVAFDVIQSEKYPDAPILWRMFSGVNSRELGRSDAVKYT